MDLFGQTGLIKWMVAGSENTPLLLWLKIQKFGKKNLKNFMNPLKMDCSALKGWLKNWLKSSPICSQTIPSKCSKNLLCAKPCIEWLGFSKKPRKKIKKLVNPSALKPEDLPTNTNYTPLLLLLYNLLSQWIQKQLFLSLLIIVHILSLSYSHKEFWSLNFPFTRGQYRCQIFCKIV